MVIKTFSGHVGGAEFVTSAQEVAAYPDFDSLQFIICDFSACDGHSIDQAALEEIAAIRLGSMWTNPNIRVVVVSSDERFTWLATAAKQPPLTGTQLTVAFATMDEAMEWVRRQPKLGGGHHLRP